MPVRAMLQMMPENADPQYPPREWLLAHLDRAQRLSNTGSWEWDIISNRILWSPQIFRIFGLVPNQFQPSYPAFLARVHPDDRQTVEERVRRALAGLEDYALDHRIVLPDGQIRMVHEEGEVRRDADGRPVSMFGAVQDVTQLRAAEAASSRSQDMLASLFRISPEALIVTDSSAKIILFSAGAEIVFGYRAEEVVGGGVGRLMPARYSARHDRHVQDFAAGGAPSLRMHERSEILGLRKNGEEFPAEASLAKLETADGFVYTAIVRDLSAAKVAEQGLIEAREGAERASLAKSSFLANMSHEIRTPLNGVMGVLSALARTELTPKQRQLVQLIETSGRALQALLGDILDLAKLDAGRIEIRQQPFDLPRMVEDTFSLFRPSALEKGLSLELAMAPGARGCFEGDDLRIRQVLSNLLSNAIKFTQTGEVRLCVDVVVCRGRNLARFVVQDTGIGFDPKLADTLFDRFEQADGSITRRFGGTGLGLAISKTLVELMSGTIVASSAPGEGARFSFEVPLQAAKARDEPQRLEPVRQVQAPDRQLQILLAEDHPINRMTVELILEPLSVALTSVENGQDAVAAAAVQTFDLILMDMQMPVMDGLSAIREIRRREAHMGATSTPICVLTANALSEHRAAAMAAGADELLTKPISANELIGYVLSCADGVPAAMRPA